MATARTRILDQMQLEPRRDFQPGGRMFDIAGSRDRVPAQRFSEERDRPQHVAGRKCYMSEHRSGLGFVHESFFHEWEQTANMLRKQGIGYLAHRRADLRPLRLGGKCRPATSCLNDISEVLRYS